MTIITTSMKFGHRGSQALTGSWGDGFGMIWYQTVHGGTENNWTFWPGSLPLVGLPWYSQHIRHIQHRRLRLQGPNRRKGQMGTRSLYRCYSKGKHIRGQPWPTSYISDISYISALRGMAFLQGADLRQVWLWEWTSAGPSVHRVVWPEDPEGRLGCLACLTFQLGWNMLKHMIQ